MREVRESRKHNGVSQAYTGGHTVAARSAGRRNKQEEEKRSRTRKRGKPESHKPYVGPVVGYWIRRTYCHTIAGKLSQNLGGKEKGRGAAICSRRRSVQKIFTWRT